MSDLFVTRDYSLFLLQTDISLSRLIVHFLYRLKINHDSHEFILEFGTVANSAVGTKTQYGTEYGWYLLMNR
jgi:hypothetical protein